MRDRGEDSTDDEHEKNGKDIDNVDQFKKVMWRMQTARKKIVEAILAKQPIPADLVGALKRTHDRLSTTTTTTTKGEKFERVMRVAGDTFSLNMKDEVIGLRKDLAYLNQLQRGSVDLTKVLISFHSDHEAQFRDELQQCKRFLASFIDAGANGKKPIFITDWDGTMKDYCSQYATNLQPVYSAVGMVRFASKFTRLSAVLTAGPLRGPGILDLTAIPIDGPLVFSGSWGREWWLSGKRIVHEDGISEEGFDALQRLADEMNELLNTSSYGQFALVGSGVQRKVDRLTLGVQTVCGQVPKDVSEQYQEAVKERMHRVDPYNHTLVFDPSTRLEVEIVAHSDGRTWNKADGVDRVMKTLNDSLETPGRVLICGDTTSDVPMVKQAATCNPDGVMAMFVGANDELQQSVRDLVGDPARSCFVFCPDVIHAAMAEIFIERELSAEID